MENRPVPLYADIVLADRPREPPPHAAAFRRIGATALVLAGLAAVLLTVRSALTHDPLITLESAVIQIARQYHTPIGLEVRPGTTTLVPASRVELEAPDATGALGELLSADRDQYTIESVGRAVEVRPVTRVRSPLDTEVDRLPPLSNTSLLVAANRILRTVTENPAFPASRRRAMRLDGLDADTRFSIDVDHVPVARALTTAVEAHGQSGWIFVPCARNRSDRTWCFRMFTFEGRIAGTTISR